MDWRNNEARYIKRDISKSNAGLMIFVAESEDKAHRWRRDNILLSSDKPGYCYFDDDSVLKCVINFCK
jgi:hypothetical protein